MSTGLTVDSLLSGAIGALIATVLAVLYQHLSILAQRRFEVMLLAVDYFDELYYQSRHIQICKKKKYIEDKEVMPKEEFMALCNKTDAMLTSSRIHARVALVYGENSEVLEKFNVLREKLQEASLLLFKARPETWNEYSQKVTDLFDHQIDPLRQATERQLLQGANMWAVFIGPAKRSLKSLRRRFQR